MIFKLKLQLFLTTPVYVEEFYDLNLQFRANLSSKTKRPSTVQSMQNYVCLSVLQFVSKMLTQPSVKKLYVIIPAAILREFDAHHELSPVISTSFRLL